MITQSCWGWDNGERHALYFEACYSSMSGGYGDFINHLRVDKAKEVISLFRIDPLAMSLKTANWFLHNYVVPSMPARLAKDVIIRPLFSKGYEALVKRPPNENELPWLEIRADVKTQCMNDVFLLFTLTRTAQEYPSIVQVMHQLVKLGMPLDAAFLLASLDSHGDGHVVIGAGQVPYNNTITKESLLKWSLKDRWEKLEHDTVIIDGPRKTVKIDAFLCEELARIPDPLHKPVDSKPPWYVYPRAARESCLEGYKIEVKLAELIKEIL